VLLLQQPSVSWRLALMREILDRNAELTGDPFRHEPLGAVEPSEITFDRGRLTVKYYGAWYRLDDERERVCEGRDGLAVVYHSNGAPAYACRVDPPHDVEPLNRLTGVEPRNVGAWS
jgi:hypothetical protein